LSSHVFFVAEVCVAIAAVAQQWMSYSPAFRFLFGSAYLFRFPSFIVIALKFAPALLCKYVNS
jgi:hypothetical protein